jgi:hypothetical protein
MARSTYMRAAPKKYNTSYKKGRIETDMYLSLLDPRVVALSIIGATEP